MLYTNCLSITTIHWLNIGVYSWILCELFVCVMFRSFLRLHNLVCHAHIFSCTQLEQADKSHVHIVYRGYV